MTTSSSAKPAAGRDDGGIGKPDCPHCEGLGYVVRNVGQDDPGFGRAVPCVCRAAEQEMTRLDSLLRLSQIGALADCTFATFKPDGHGLTQTRQRNLRTAYDDTLKYAEEPRGWLVLKGGYGCGKTHLAAAIANHALAFGRAVLFVVVPDLLDHLRATFNPSANVRLDKRFDEVKTAPLLVLDDLGTESATAWAREKLYQLFNYRYNAHLPTVITTAVPIEQLDPRLASRMLDGIRCTFFVLEAPSYRGKSTRPRRRHGEG